MIPLARVDQHHLAMWLNPRNPALVSTGSEKFKGSDLGGGKFKGSDKESKASLSWVGTREGPPTPSWVGKGKRTRVSPRRLHPAWEASCTQK